MFNQLTRLLFFKEIGLHDVYHPFGTIAAQGYQPIVRLVGTVANPTSRQTCKSPEGTVVHLNPEFPVPIVTGTSPRTVGNPDPETSKSTAQNLARGTEASSDRAR